MVALLGISETPPGLWRPMCNGLESRSSGSEMLLLVPWLIVPSRSVKGSKADNKTGHRKSTKVALFCTENVIFRSL